MHQEWKNLEKKNQSYRNIIKNVPSFTKIFKENVQLKTQAKATPQESFKTFREVEPLQIAFMKPKEDVVSQNEVKKMK